jgi:hypothetical protein
MFQIGDRRVLNADLGRPKQAHSIYEMYIQNDMLTRAIWHASRYL